VSDGRGQGERRREGKDHAGSQTSRECAREGERVSAHIIIGGNDSLTPLAPSLTPHCSPPSLPTAPLSHPRAPFHTGGKDKAGGVRERWHL